MEIAEPTKKRYRLLVEVGSFDEKKEAEEIAQVINGMSLEFPVYQIFDNEKHTTIERQLCPARENIPIMNVLKASWKLKDAELENKLKD